MDVAGRPARWETEDQEPAMTVTTTSLTRAAGVAAAAAGAIFIGVQVGHPQLNLTTITTTDVFIRDCFKVLMCALAVAGISGMYLSQVRRNGVLGLVGWLVFGAGYLCIMCTSFVSAVVGLLPTVFKVQGILYLAGGLLFGIALFRAHVLARWAAVLLAVSGFASVVLSLMPDAFYRLLAYPNAIAMIGLGVSLWLSQRNTSAVEAGAEASSVRTTPSPAVVPAA